MHKIILGTLLLGLSMIFVSQPMAANVPGDLPAPAYINCTLNADSVCFDWGIVGDAVKYSVDIEVPTDVDGDGLVDMIVELSFGTGDRADGLQMDDPTYNLWDDTFINETEEGIPLTGTASAKVKALGPGKGKGRQNNSFTTEPCTFIIPSLTDVVPY